MSYWLAETPSIRSVFAPFKGARHEEPPSVMPPVEHWKAFQFTHNMSSNQPLAKVIHPVDRPLQANCDANGVLQESGLSSMPKQDVNSDRYLSPCCVGHLAQHTFCQLLYDAARQNALELQAEICFDTKVVQVNSIDGEAGPRRFRVTTEHGTTYETNLCIAADGAHSTLRESVAKISSSGQRDLQHLINIHVTLDQDQAAVLHANNNHAMLYSIFSEHVVAMVVCHSLSDYVIQIPYFPPYQTLEDDFSEQKVHTIVGAIFGDKITKWKVQSVGPWTMNALIADQYYNADKGIVLVGDAAHVFPPAGGFGMNTGLQDVHNLAWRLAWAYHADTSAEVGSKAKSGLSLLPTMLEQYQNERRPVAQQNAALSVRNYKRLLEVTKACYLNESHPATLTKLLKHSPLPLAAQRQIFRTSFQAALFPLSWLRQPESPYARHIRNNLAKILRTGTGLPLLFPKFEIGFGYGDDTLKNIQASDWRTDTWADRAVLEVGKLVPHVSVLVRSSDTEMYPNLLFLDAAGSSQTISTSNLPAQLSTTERPTFVLLLVGQSKNLKAKDPSFLPRLGQDLSQKLGLGVKVIQILSSNDTSGHTIASQSKNQLVVVQPERAEDVFSFFNTRHKTPYLVLIRPDSHVAAIQTFDDETIRDEEWMSTIVQDLRG